ncbi:hypothetical protein [Kitasatospora cineracea]|uniref:Uncharacterized protein n=1 Tax=Kitasatospora cineracea TaxID=88074 RepID=A0A3N4RUQ5_9ACTN|nr:hypothetical protein [Kitasatospora cineracea]RPE34771.1 hypothetical protein EDD38_3107 [Kitasatospora cineracea]
MEKIIPAEGVRATLLWPVTGLFAGTPVLVRKLTASQRARRAEAAALKGRQAELNAAAVAAADAEFAKKLAAEADPAKKLALVQAREAAAVAARTFELEQAKAARKAKRSKLGEAAGAAALLLVIGGPLVWSLARPLIGPGVGLLAGVWWIGALIHAPGPAKASAAADAEADGEQEVPADADDQDDAPEAEPEPPRPTLAPALLASSIEHMVATRAQSDGGAGNVLIGEALAVFQRNGWFEAADAREFGAAVRAAGIPPKKAVAVGSGAARKTSAGWSVAHLQEVLGRVPSLPPQAVADRTPVEAA